MSEKQPRTVDFDSAAFSIEMENALNESDETTIYKDHVEWVNDWLASTIEIDISANKKWCTQWWEHPQAVTEIIALWGAWEEAQASKELSARSTWWVYHFSYHWAVLTASSGPFMGCKPGNHTKGQLLPVELASRQTEATK